MPKSNTAKVWKWFVISYVFPVVGVAIGRYAGWIAGALIASLIIYFRSRNTKLAGICLTLSIFHPLLIASVITTIIDNDSTVGLLSFLMYFALTIMLMGVFGENRYKYFIPVWYFGLPGLIYSCCFGCKNDKVMRDEMVYFFFGGMLALVLAVIILIIIGF